MSAMFPLLFLATSFTFQASLDRVPQDPAPRGTMLAVRAPTFPNSTCPIMGKKASLPLFAETEQGRIYVCCKPCIRKVHADVQQAYKTAYPTIRDLANKVCPVSGEPIGAESVSLVLQGLRIRLCCEACLAEARKHAQVTLARVHEPRLYDVHNERCPVDGRPVQPNSFAVVGAAIVRLSSPSHLMELQKAPGAMLEKARAGREDVRREVTPQHRPVRPPAKPASGEQGAASTGKEGA